MKVAQVLPQTHLIENAAGKKVKSILDITKELNLKPISVRDNITEALKITSNNGFYFNGKTPTGSMDTASKNVIDFII